MFTVVDDGLVRLLFNLNVPPPPPRYIFQSVEPQRRCEDEHITCIPAARAHQRQLARVYQVHCHQGNCIRHKQQQTAANSKKTTTTKNNEHKQTITNSNKQ